MQHLPDRAVAIIENPFLILVSSKKFLNSLKKPFHSGHKHNYKNCWPELGRKLNYNTDSH